MFNENDPLDQYPDIAFVRRYFPLATIAYGIQCPSHGALVIGVTEDFTHCSGLEAAQWKGQPVEFRHVEKEPDADPDFGPPVIIRGRVELTFENAYQMALKNAKNQIEADRKNRESLKLKPHSKELEAALQQARVSAYVQAINDLRAAGYIVEPEG